MEINGTVMRKLIFGFAFVMCGFALRGQSAKGVLLKLRVATYNVGHFNQGDAGGLELDEGIGKKVREKWTRLNMLEWRDWIGKQGIDILGVQEWNKYFDRDSTFYAETEVLKPFYNHLYFGEEHTWIYNGIATNYQLTNIRKKYWFGDYYAILGDLRIGDKIVTIISTHIPWQKEWHTQAFEMLMEELKQHEYFICMGDMNALDEEQLRFLEAGFNMANGGHLGWFTTSGGAVRLQRMTDGIDRHIDNVITSGNMKIMNVSAPHTGLNDYDHLPVIADIVITE